MLKLMIVDDEYLFREALKVSLPWAELGYEICCDAENGYDALEKMKQHKPDVALVDINMPTMDGLELAAEVKESGLDVKIIIITGYGEFTYAHQAIQLGVENYLLKPVDEKELADNLTSIKKLIEKEAATKLEIESFRQQVQQYRPMLKEMVLNELLQGNQLRTRADFLKFGDYFSSTADSCTYQVVVMEMDEKKDSGWSVDDRQLWSFAVSNIAGEIFETVCSFDICRDIESRINVILYHEKGQKEKEIDVVNLCQRIRVSVLKYMKFSVTIGIGNAHEDIVDLPLSYKEAVFSLNNKLAMGENKVFVFEDFAEYDMKGSLYPIELKKQLLMNMRVGDIAEVEQMIHSVFSQAQTMGYSSDYITVMCVELASTCLEFAAETGYSLKAILGTDLNIVASIQEKKSINELELWIRQIFSRACEQAHNNKNKRSTKIVEEAKRFINDNFSRFDLKIDEIARELHVKYGHLCFLFKRETGSTINDYITQIRITKARELMDEGVHSVTEVSERVGYADANYFGKCFKKLYGLAPGRYMEHFTSPR